MHKTIIISALVFLFVLSACNPQKMLSKRLAGEWLIESYEERNLEGTNPSMSNIGTITFNRDGSGSKEISYSIMQVAYTDDKPFQWENTENTVTLDGEESDFAKVWFVIENKKTFQEWRSTDSEGNVQIIKLEKE